MSVVKAQFWVFYKYQIQTAGLKYQLMRTGEKAKLLLFVFIVVYSLYGWMFIQQTSINFEGKKYYTLFDDAMISMRYAKNLVNGYGLVWNPDGEKVEGYTNFFWVLYMTVPHLLQIPSTKTSLFIQLTVLALLAAALSLIYKTAILLTDGNTNISAGTVVMAGLFFPITYWSLSGMETGPLIFLLSAVVYLCVKVLKTGKFSVLLYFILFIMTLVRIDMYLLFVFIVAFMFYSDKVNAGKHLTAGITGFAVSLGGMTLFRVLYYHDLLPNTYYLKMTGYPLFWRVAHGLLVSVETVIRGGLIPYVTAIAVTLVIKKREYFLIAGTFCVQFFYSIFTGGDAWENAVNANRYITTVMPVLFILTAAGLWQIVSVTLKKHSDKVKQSIYWMGIAAMIILLNCGKGIEGYKELFLIQPAAHADHARRVIAKSYIVERIAGEKAVIGIFMAGKIPYFLDRTYIDFLGKNDIHIAHLPSITPGNDLKFMDKVRFFVPGHMKLDYSYSIADKKPDIIDDIYWPEQLGKEAEASLKNNYIEFVMGIKLLKNSPNINWGDCNEIIQRLN